MDFSLLELGLARHLLLSTRSQEDLPLNPRRVSPGSDLFFVIANLKKNNEGLEAVRNGDTEFQKAVISGRLIFLPFDFYALESGLFERDEHDELIFCRRAVDAEQPGDTMKLVSLTNFDRVYGTNLVEQFEPLYA
jgi:hypothetical protein